jgi:hypothetical protein
VRAFSFFICNSFAPCVHCCYVQNLLFACIRIIVRKITEYCAFQVELSHPNAELRLLEVFYHKIYKVMDIVVSYILF